MVIRSRKILICFFIIIILAQPVSGAENILRTKYPVILVHGILERTDITYPNSSGPIAKYLNRMGFETYIADLDALGSVESNGKMLSEIINRLCADKNVDKVNIIAFSKGGIDSRLAAYQYGAAGHIASITTVSTPHRGTPVADLFSSNPLTAGGLIEIAMNTLAGLAGDQQQNFIKAVAQLSIKEMDEFNNDYPDLPGIAYYSFSAVMEYDDPHIVFNLLRNFIYYYEGENDGLIPVSSAQWGEYLGTVNDFMDYNGSLNHPDLVGLDIYQNQDFDYLNFYYRIVKLLIEKGF